MIKSLTLGKASSYFSAERGSDLQTLSIRQDRSFHRHSNQLVEMSVRYFWVMQLKS